MNGQQQIERRDRIREIEKSFEDLTIVANDAILKIENETQQVLGKEAMSRKSEDSRLVDRIELLEDRAQATENEISRLEFERGLSDAKLEFLGGWVVGFSSRGFWSRLNWILTGR